MQNYLSEIVKYFKDENSSEHSYRTSFENYLKEIFPADKGYFTQQDQRAINGNKPDFIVLKNNIPLLYIEVKKVGEDLDKIEKSNQADRYFGYDNLIISDYVNFRFFRNGQKYEEEVSLGSIDKKEREISNKNNIESLNKTILDFVNSHKESIKSGKQLAKIMGGKAMRIRDNVREMLAGDTDRYADLTKMLDVVKESLVSSLDNETFADMYAQTLIYGLFAARYNDKTAESFSRAEARELVPKTNPFLRSFFDHIAGNTFPDRLRFIVDELCEVFQHADVEKLLTDFYGKEKDNKDPIIHFYEDFLREYDSKKKMEMGVFYTPKPVVSFIVRAVDSILKSEFGLARGLADTTKIQVEKLETDYKTGKQKKVQKEYHKVQVLDVATGTGTFLNEVINNIHANFVGQEGRWASYVENDLLPRLHGFELMMASYTIAHLKLGMTLHDTKAGELKTRLGVYLTNTLEAPVDYANQGTLFGLMDTIAEESKNASRIKSEYPIMCVIGNPPYSIKSLNMNKVDKDLVQVYKYIDGIKIKEKGALQFEKNLNDDYVKFIRFSESLIEKNKEGVIGMITNNGYIDNPTFRGMRWHLRNTFDKIYVIDLHGSAKKNENDQNVFDIQQGVSIILAIKNNNNDKKPAFIYQADFFGTRQEKFKVLENINIEKIEWNKLPENCDVWKLEGKGKSEYLKGFSVAELFLENGVGIVTSHDDFVVDYKKEDLIKKFTDFSNSERDEEGLHRNFFVKKKKGWNILNGYDNLKKEINIEKYVLPISYRAFDTRYILYETKLVWSPTPKRMNQFIDKENIGLVFCKQVKASNNWFHIGISKYIMESSFISNKTGEINSIAPIYLYTEQGEKVPNLNKEIWDKINEIVGETTPEDILDYIYASLHSPKYRETYKEFLKIDFPRVPYPTDKKEFERLVKLGTKLRGLHLMTDSECENLITTYPESGSGIVEKVKYENGNVYINDIQYFGNVPEISWSFYIGGYQPAQKYLKDRKGRNLTSDEIHHYQKIIKVLFETDKLMKEIDK